MDKDHLSLLEIKFSTNNYLERLLDGRMVMSSVSMFEPTAMILPSLDLIEDICIEPLFGSSWMYYEGHF